MVKRQKRRPLYLRWMEDGEWLTSSGNDERELREIFHWLRSSKRVQVDVLDLGVDYLTPRDYIRLVDLYGAEIPCLPMWFDHRPLEIILNAIRESDLQPEQFSVYTTSYGVPLSMFAPGAGMRLLEPRFRHLSKLTIILQAAPGMEDRLSDDEDVHKFVQFLRSLSQTLKELTLDANYRTNEESDQNDLGTAFDMLRKDVFFPNIERFFLSEFATDYHGFISYLAKHRKTLKTYDFRCIYATGTGTELEDDKFRESVLKDLEAAGLPEPDPTWNMTNWET